MIVRIWVNPSVAISRTIPFLRNMICIDETINLKWRMPMGEVRAGLGKLDSDISGKAAL
jgi:hypothetical protein